MSSIRLGHGESVELDVTLTFEEAFSGKVVEKVLSRDVSCKECKGQGSRSAFVKPRLCSACQGRGFRQFGVGAFQVRTALI
jgi:DnaJ-class molecular chaperone